MKKTVITIALFAVLGTLAVSCQKENVFDNAQIEMEQSAVYKICSGVEWRETTNTHQCISCLKEDYRAVDIMKHVILRLITQYCLLR